MEVLLKDIRYGARTLLRNPGFAAIAVLTLGLGIGATTAIFTLVNAVLLRPLPWPEPDRLVWIWETNPTNSIPEEPASAPNFLDWKAQNSVFESMAGFVRQRPVVATDSGPELIVENVVTPDYFSVLKATPMLGRAFVENDSVEGNHRVAVISHGLWQRRFGGEPGVLEKTIKIQGREHAIIGVLPAGFETLRTQEREPTEVWRPLAINLQRMTRRSDFLGVIARLKPGVEIAQAQAEMDAIAARLAQQYPPTNANWTTRVVALHDRLSGTARPALLVLLGAVGFLLLLVCANVANLLLARASGRDKEIAIRTALGAGPWRLVRQLLTESMLLSVSGGVVGVLLAVWGLAALSRLGPPAIHGIDAVSLDARVLFFALGVSLLTGLTFGILPALQSAGAGRHQALKEGGRGTGAGPAGRRLRDLLVVSEMALALLLLIGALLMIRSLVRLQSIDPGFRTSGFLTASLSLPRVDYPEDHQVRAFYGDLFDRFAGLPGVTAVAGSGDLPHDIGNYLSFEVEGRPPAPDGVVQDAVWTYVTPGYFEALGIPLIQGRLLSAMDPAPLPRPEGAQDDPNAPQDPMSAVVSESFAKKWFDGEDPLGRRITLGDPVTGPWMTIVGVVGDTRNQGLDEPSYPAIYQVFAQATSTRMTLFVRTGGDPLALAATVRAAVREIDKDQPLAAVMSLEEHLAESLAARRFNMLLLTLFAALALLLAAVGIYGVISYGVARRSHEIGVRMALGAQRADVMRLIARQGLGLTLAGIAVGLLLAAGLTRLLSSLLFDVSATDPLTFGLTATLLALVAVPATWIPARRATKVDPLTALRME